MTEPNLRMARPIGLIFSVVFVIAGIRFYKKKFGISTGQVENLDVFLFYKNIKKQH